VRGGVGQRARGVLGIRINGYASLGEDSLGPVLGHEHGDEWDTPRQLARGGRDRTGDLRDPRDERWDEDRDDRVDRVARGERRDRPGVLLRCGRGDHVDRVRDRSLGR